MKTKLLALVVACTGTLLLSSWLFAAQEPKPSTPAATKPEGTKPASTKPEGTKPEGTKPAATKPAPKKPGDGVTAIVGGDVYTVSREIIRGGTVMFKDGKITAVGLDLPIPEGATVIDAKGKFITPGFVAISTNNLALRAGAGGRGGAGGGIGGRPDRFADQLNPFDRNLKFCLGVGITTANVEVDAGGFGRRGRSADEMADDDFRICPCCGMTYLPTEPITPPVPTERQPRRSAVIKLTYGDLGPMLVKENPFYHLPASSLAGALNRTQWREAIKRAKQAQRDADSGDDEGGDLGGGFPRAGGADTSLRSLVKKEIPLRTEASNVDTLRDMIALAKELDYRLIVDEVVEGWVVPKELAEAGVSVIYTPRNRRAPRPGREDTSGSSIESSRVFEEAGVPFSVSSLGSSVSLDGIAGRDLMSLPLEAAFAVRGGCSEQAALAALTIVPARQLGLEARIGSIDVGKDADLLILDGPPLDYRTYVQQALVGGKCYYDRTKDRIYPDTPGR